MKKGIPRKQVTLVSMNVWFGMDARGYLRFGEFESSARRQARFNILAAGLKNLQPDVIGIQEANTLPDYAKNLADEIGYDAVWKTTNSGYDASLLWADGVTPRDPLNRLEAQFDAKMARRIDFIFLSYQFEPNMVIKADLVFTEPTGGLFASDHFGI